MNSIEQGIEAIRRGEMVIVVDSADRENEGDLICAADRVSPEIINFMTIHGRGLICVALTRERCEELDLDPMVGRNTSLHETPFTVSVDLIGQGCTTGISAQDRAKTIQSLVNPKTKPDDLARPGHIFPLRAQSAGTLRRAGHTEAAVDMARLAGLYPAGVLVEIMSKDGSMARLPELNTLAQEHGLKIISIEELIAYRRERENRPIRRVVSVSLPTQYGDFQLIAYQAKHEPSKEHLALVKGTWEKGDPILVRVHSSCVTGDIFGSSRCDCGQQLHTAMKMVEKEGKGVVLYMQQEGRGIGLINKLKSYRLQERGLDTVEANIHLGFQADERDYGIGAQILVDLNATRIRLMTNNPKKRAALKGYGLSLVENVPLIPVSNPHNVDYLSVKRRKLGHDIP
ncbi:MAG: bifunctional 3,4-dihydroxy-2-butanone-4-phosphate synthase/GTP cyclohydrolase II [Cytophagales bacterium]|nr:bifunctional 3,4-dihydroxy-2-butanone-4-phosphate synthase/GTP cyclohydrolase II [Cytophagales bacterium]